MDILSNTPTQTKESQFENPVQDLENKNFSFIDNSKYLSHDPHIRSTSASPLTRKYEIRRNLFFLFLKLILKFKCNYSMNIAKQNNLSEANQIGVQYSDSIKIVQNTQSITSTNPFGDNFSQFNDNDLFGLEFDRIRQCGGLPTS